MTAKCGSMGSMYKRFTFETDYKLPAAATAGYPKSDSLNFFSFHSHAYPSSSSSPWSISDSPFLNASPTFHERYDALGPLRPARIKDFTGIHQLGRYDAYTHRLLANCLLACLLDSQHGGSLAEMASFVHEIAKLAFDRMKLQK